MRIDRVREMKQAGTWKDRYISAPGLAPEYKKLGDSITGIEIGVAAGENIVYMLDECENISKIYAIDPWLPYTDCNGTGTEEIVEASYEVSLDNFSDYPGRVSVFRVTSDQAMVLFEDGSVDYIFVDGNHDYEFVKNDLLNYYPKVKKGGLITGHDLGLPSVNNAIRDFVKTLDYIPNIQGAANGAWFFTKER